MRGGLDAKDGGRPAVGEVGMMHATICAGDGFMDGWMGGRWLAHADVLFDSGSTGC